MASGLRTAIYGVHGRPPNQYLQQLFTSLGSSDRKGSKGCIVVPQDHLKNFIDLIFDDPSFKNHQGVKKIKDLRSRKDPKNVLIALKDFEGKSLSQYNIEGKVGPVVEIDIKIIVIDTSDPTTWPSWGSSKKEHPVYQLLKSGESHEKYYRLVTDCTVKGPISVYQKNATRSNVNKIDHLQKGDRLVGVYKHPHSPSSRVDLEFYRDGRTHKTEGWISDLTNLTCSSNYYWSSKAKSTLK